MENFQPSGVPAALIIRSLCGDRVFGRGQEIAATQRLSGLVRAGDEIFGRCEGSMGEVYELRVELQSGQVRDASCSCPFDGGGWCKHLVGLLLRLGEAADDFENLPPLGTLIGELSGAEQAILIENMVRRAPSLLPLLTLTRAARQPETGGEPGDELAALRPLVRRALSGRDAREGVMALETALNRAGALENARDVAGAGAIYLMLLEELTRAAPRFEARLTLLLEEGYDEENFDFGVDWAQTAFRGLERALQSEGVAPEARETWTRGLWQTWLECRDLEYFALPDSAGELLARASSGALWQEIEAVLRAELAENRGARDYGIIDGDGEFVPVYAQEYRLETPLQWLVFGLEAHGRAGEITEVVRKWGSRRQKFELLLREGDYEAAEALARSENSGSFSLFECAEQLEAAGQTARAARLGQIALADEEKRAGKWPFSGPVHAGQTRALEWMTRFWTRQKQSGEAMPLAARLFARRPAGETLLLWKAAVEPRENWDETYGQREAELPDDAARLELALTDARAARALELFDALPAKTGHPFTLALARLCQDQFPRRALPLFEAAAQGFIASRVESDPRSRYREAAQMWRCAREIHARLGTLDQWQAYLLEQRAAHKRLRALWDEVQKAGVI